MKRRRNPLAVALVVFALLALGATAAEVVVAAEPPGQAVSAQTTGNVVPNPGFEEGGCGDTPVVCGWSTNEPDTTLSQDTTNRHAGSASLNVQCPSPACDWETGGAGHASTDPAFCAPIGPGAHQASFWYSAAAQGVALRAAFYATPDCSGPSSSDSLSARVVAGDWQQATGALAAPPGTQSALFSLEVSGGCVGICNPTEPCYCGVAANFDDVEVDGLGDTTPPSISSFSPTSGIDMTWVTITGRNFIGATDVAFNGAAVSQFYVISSTEIVTWVMENSTTGPISVTTPFGTGVSTGSFTVFPPPPDICCFEPLSGPVGGSVEIMGRNFTGATSVTFNGVADPNFVVISSRDITAHVPPGATSGPIAVTTPGGTYTSFGSFTVTAVPPSIGSFTPTSGPVGTSVSITGTSFAGATSVKFAGIAAGYTVNSATSITAAVPSGAASGPISVTTPGGTATSSGSFTVTPQPPTISSFTPTSGPVGTSVSITGTGLTGATSVKFAGTTAGYTVNSATSITAAVPTGAASGPVSVTTPGGTATSSSSFTVSAPPPKITGFSPTSAHAGQQVKITGSNFTGATSVKLGTAFASFTLNSSTTITATVPKVAHGYYSWSVTTPSGATTSTTYFHVK